MQINLVSLFISPRQNVVWRQQLQQKLINYFECFAWRTYFFLSISAVDRFSHCVASGSW